jgi:predicted metal-dependent HD superfamily phosphohydrolase
MAGDELELRIAWERHLGVGAVPERWHERVITLHRDATRHYHVVHHVVWVVRHVTTFVAGGLVDDADAVVAAAFFHDAIYDVTSNDNETSSARLAGQCLAELDWEPERIGHVATMIESTAGHQLAGTDRDTQALLAADLSVLAAEPARYADYARAVRREYAHVGDADWAAGRSTLLRGLLGRDRLFAPTLGLDLWEHQARANITAELASLRA